jgi:hypothetical protein
MSLDFGRLRVDDDDGNHDQTDVYRVESPTSFTKNHFSCKLSLPLSPESVLHVGPRESFPKSPLVPLPYIWSIVAKELGGLPWRFREEGASIKGAGKNALISGPPTNYGFMSYPPGSKAGRHSHILNKDKQISSYKGVTTYAS